MTERYWYNMDSGSSPKLLDKSIQKIWIKDGKRKLMSDTGHMYMGEGIARKTFGRYRGGKYGLKQEL